MSEPPLKSSIRHVGNSSAVIIPKRLLTQIGMKAGDPIEIVSRDGTLVILPVKKPARAGWADQSRIIAEAGEGCLAWPEVGNTGDADLEW